MLVESAPLALVAGSRAVTQREGEIQEMHYGDAMAGQVGVGVTAAGVWPRFGAPIINGIICGRRGAL